MSKIISYLKVIQTRTSKKIGLLNYCSSKSIKIAAAATPESKPVTETVCPKAKLPEDQYPVLVEADLIPKNNISHDFLKIKIHPSSVKNLSTFDEVPGPPFLRLFSKFWSNIPYLNSKISMKSIQNIMSVGSVLTWGGYLHIINYLLNKYGPVVRLYGPFGGDVIILNHPEHIRTVFENEGPYPIRSGLESVEQYFLKNRKHKLGSLVIASGQEWKELRKSVEQPLKLSTVLAQQFEKIEILCDEFIERILIIRNNQEEVTNDFKNEIYKWSLECLSLILLNEKLNFMSNTDLSKISDPGLLLKYLDGAMRSIQRCESGLHLWKLYDTYAYMSLIKNCEMIDNILNTYIEKTRIGLNDKPTEHTEQNLTFLEKILMSDGIIKENVMTILLDMLLIGVHTVTHTIIYLLYNLAKSPKCQTELFKEITCFSSVKFTKDTKESITTSPFLQACIKESLRLKPPLPLLSRVTTTDLNIYNYLIPKGTYIIMATSFSSLKLENFEDPQKFLPERWLTNANIHDNMFATLPFGYGPKSCVAKELVEMNVGILISKLIKKFRIEYNYGDIKISNKIFSLPNGFLKFRFIERI